MFVFLFEIFVMVSFGLAWLGLTSSSFRWKCRTCCCALVVTPCFCCCFIYFPFAEVLDGLHYQDSHEWVKVEGDVGIVGITDHAQVKCVKHHHV